MWFISAYMHIKQWDTIIHPCHNFNKGLANPPLITIPWQNKNKFDINYNTTNTDATRIFIQVNQAMMIYMPSLKFAWIICTIFN